MQRIHSRSLGSWILWNLLVLVTIQLTACATRPPDVAGSDKPHRQLESSQPRQDEPGGTRVKGEKTGPEDTENRWPYRLLAAPEYAWAGLAYPFR
jgi:hypothetical protein